MYASWSAWIRGSSGRTWWSSNVAASIPLTVVQRVERVALDVVRRRAQVQRPPVEQHHADVDPGLAGLDHALSKAIEEGRVELLEVEAGLAVLCQAGTGPRPRLRRHVQVEVAASGLRADLLPPPQPDEVVAALGEEAQVAVVIEALGLGRAFGARTHPVVEVVPDVRAGEVHGPLGAVV